MIIWIKDASLNQINISDNLLISKIENNITIKTINNIIKIIIDNKCLNIIIFVINSKLNF